MIQPEQVPVEDQSGHEADGLEELFQPQEQKQDLEELFK
jgi:hypothetical protein